MTWTERSASAAIAYDIEPQYERAFHGLHPAYFSDVMVLGHDGWEPSWSLMWAETAAVSATFTERTATSATWIVRT